MMDVLGDLLGSSVELAVARVLTHDAEGEPKLGGEPGAHAVRDVEVGLGREQRDVVPVRRGRGRRSTRGSEVRAGRDVARRGVERREIEPEIEVLRRDGFYAFRPADRQVGVASRGAGLGARRTRRDHGEEREEESEPGVLLYIHAKSPRGNRARLGAPVTRVRHGSEGESASETSRGDPSGRARRRHRSHESQQRKTWRRARRWEDEGPARIAGRGSPHGAPGESRSGE